MQAITNSIYNSNACMIIELGMPSVGIKTTMIHSATIYVCIHFSFDAMIEVLCMHG